MKPEAFPFLRIAKRFNLDYGEVLETADWIKNGGHLALSTWIRTGEAPHELHEASAIQQSIRDGEIDWITGERNAANS